MTISRRRFSQLLALSPTAALFPRAGGYVERDADLRVRPLPPTPRNPDEKYWQEVRARYLIPRGVSFMNAANLCPSPLPVVEALDRNTRDYEADPSPEFRSRLMQDGRETARQLLAAMLGATPEEIVITRNTSEGNNLVSSGLILGPND
jgi:selenocysteine lyase/cysteine desulfurase